MERLWGNVQAEIVITDAFLQENAMYVSSSPEWTKGVMIPRQLLSVIMILLWAEYKLPQLVKLLNVLAARNLVIILAYFWVYFFCVKFYYEYSILYFCELFTNCLQMEVQETVQQLGFAQEASAAKPMEAVLDRVR